MNKKHNSDIELINASTCLLLAVSDADDCIDSNEIKIIKEIIIDFFNIESLNLDDVIQENLITLEESTDFYEFGKILNENFTYQDKIDFICCTYEVAFIDSKMHYYEDHMIKKISNILNVEHKDLINAKSEIESLLLKK